MSIGAQRDAGAPAAAFASGTFHLRFDDDRPARSAARDAGAVGFACDVRADGAGGWDVALTRRSQPFPLDDQARYVVRLRTIAAAHGGTFERFDQD